MQLTKQQLAALGHQIIAMTGVPESAENPDEYRVQLRCGYGTKTPEGVGAVVLREVLAASKIPTKRARITVVPRVERAYKSVPASVALFYYDEFGDLLCYTRQGQHSSADLGYYRDKTSPVRPDDLQALALFQHYCNLPGGDGCEFVLAPRLAKARTL